MELVSVDTPGEPPKNWRMTDAERARIGRKLKALRIGQGLDQIPAAKKAGLAVATLQAIEANRQKHPVKDSNIEKYAQIFGASIRKLLKSDEIAATDPRFAEFNEEHIDVAWAYMRAKRLPRQAVEVLLSHPLAEEAIARIVLRLATLPPERVQELDRWLFVAPHLLPLIEDVWRRMLIDPPYVAIVREGVTVYAHYPIPSTPHTQTKPRATPTHRAK
jgi:transcriptional regulator with XRE-family HTH domain